jgi:hypothetical protein
VESRGSGLGVKGRKLLVEVGKRSVQLLAVSGILIAFEFLQNARTRKL